MTEVTKEEEFHRATWQVLKKIKALILQSDDCIIKYRITKDFPFQEKDLSVGFERERAIINKLVTEGVLIRKEDEDYISDFNASIGETDLPFFVIEMFSVNDKNFEELYKSYETKGFDKVSPGKYLLEINQNGVILLYTPYGKSYLAKFNPVDNAYLVACQWATTPYVSVAAKEIAVKLVKGTKIGTNSSTEDKVYNAVITLRKSFGMPTDLEAFIFGRDEKRYQLRADTSFI